MHAYSRIRNYALDSEYQQYPEKQAGYQAKDSAVKESLQNSNRYGITRGAAYFKKGGDHE